MRTHPLISPVKRPFHSRVLKRWCWAAAALPLILFAQGGAAIERQSLSIQILYDNYVYTDGCKAEWGYACLILTDDRTVLFDTGRLPSLLRHNMARLQVDPRGIDTIVISHSHADHTGGLTDLITLKPQATVYLPASVPQGMVHLLREKGASVLLEKTPVSIAPRMRLSGEMQSANGITEQALFIRTDGGWVIITGCAHPGIVAIVRRAKAQLELPIDLLAGGFHLLNHSAVEIRKVIRQLQDLGVTRVGPSHCTGDRPMALFQDVYGENFVRMGVGRKLTWGD